jgi:dienelactone hydrolase
MLTGDCLTTEGFFMSTTRASLFLIVLLLSACQLAAAQNGAAAAPLNGKIIEQARYTLPAYEQLSDRFKSAYSREVVEKIKNSSELELWKIRYMSDGLKISGFIYRPKNTEGKKLPAIIFNRGGLADGAIGPDNYNYIYEMYRYASEGFVVIASQYRGTDGAGGRDEAGGLDTNDVINLVPLAQSLGYVDMNKLFMWGYSRGAVMTLQAISRGVPLKAAVVVGAPTDYLKLEKDPGFAEFARRTFADYDARKEEQLKSRSSALWADKLDVPLLILHGGDDSLSPTQAMILAQKLEEQGKLYQLMIYAKDDHAVSANAEDRLNKTVDWFKNVRRISIAQRLIKTIERQDVEAAVKQYYELKKSAADRYDWHERELNQLGYILLNAKLIKEAIEIFKLNVAAYPQAFNTYDSLGEAYLASGEREQAIKNYKKSLELNPQNQNALEVLKRIGAQ